MAMSEGAGQSRMAVQEALARLIRELRERSEMEGLSEFQKEEVLAAIQAEAQPIAEQATKLNRMLREILAEVDRIGGDLSAAAERSGRAALRLEAMKLAVQYQCTFPMPYDPEHGIDKLADDFLAWLLKEEAA